MTLQQMLAIMNKYAPYTAGIPGIRTRQQLENLSRDPEFTRKRQAGAEYRKKVREADALADTYGKKHQTFSNVNRFIVHDLKEEKTPEDVAFNQDLTDMLYCNEGIGILTAKHLNTVLTADLGMCYATDLDDALEKCIANPGLAEQMKIANMLLDGNNVRYSVDPLVKEQLQYSQTAMQCAGYTALGALYYGSHLSLLYGEKYHEDDAAIATENVHNNRGKFTFEEGKTVSDFFGQQHVHAENNSEAWRETVRRLKEEGKLGPNSMYWRTFDAEGKRIPMDDAINRLAKGEDIRFVEMDAVEKEKLRKALMNPVAPKRTKAEPVAGKGLQEICAELYKEMDKVDSMFIPSSEDFRNLKATLKEMSERKTFPDTEQAKEMLHKAVQMTSGYTSDKAEAENAGTLSQRGKDRLAVMKKIHSTLAPKLGVLAYHSYVSKTMVKEAVAENQEKMTAAIKAEDKAHRRAIAQSKAEARAKAKQPWWGELRADESGIPGMNENTPFGRLAKNAAVGIEGIRRNLQPNAVLEENFTNGIYFSQAMAYNLIVAERKRVQPGNIGPYEKLLNKVGAKCFCLAMKDSGIIREFVNGGITPVKVANTVKSTRAVDAIANMLNKEDNLVQFNHSANRHFNHQQAKKAAAAAPVVPKK